MTPVPRDAEIVNALSIDVEDWFQVSAFAPHIDRADWDRLPCRVERNVDRLLELLAGSRARATFFTLGWIAERYPQLVRRIHAAGHEVASHGYGHLRASEQSREQFRNDIRSARALLEDQAGAPVRGYRAPSFSIGRDNLWAFDELAEAGYRYSSSVYPVAHDHYGMPEAPRHPWEIDPGQPRMNGVGFKTRFRHYLNLERTERRLGRLLEDFRWGRVDQVFAPEMA